ncbi:Conidiation protein 6-domain-containing protein [Pyronema omphalodes]|nr:Conidiation protein 6-domain-containing protein [Pyronema omphalodes]
MNIGDSGNKGNVIGGYKATLKNPHASEEAKEHAQKMLDKLGRETETSIRNEKKDDAHNVSTEGKNPHNVIGGYKATLKNPNVSDEAKQHAKECLEELEMMS